MNDGCDEHVLMLEWVYDVHSANRFWLVIRILNWNRSTCIEQTKLKKNRVQNMKWMTVSLSLSSILFFILLSSTVQIRSTFSLHSDSASIARNNILSSLAASHYDLIMRTGKAGLILYSKEFSKIVITIFFCFLFCHLLLVRL